MSVIIAADIGGTNCRLGAFEAGGSNLVMAGQNWIPTASVNHAHDFLRAIQQSLDLDVHCAGALVVAVAGPIRSGMRAALTNLALELDFEPVARELPLFGLINDFTAQAWAIAAGVAAAHLAGAANGASQGVKALLGAGTGLGFGVLVESSLPGTEGRPAVLPSENGHTAFPFVGEEENALHEFLRKRFEIPWASREDVLAGRGLEALHCYLTGREAPAAEAAVLLGADTPLLRCYSRFYGRVCRDWMLSSFCTGGLWIAGGIAARNPLCVRSQYFFDGLYSSPRWNDFLRSVPVFLLEDQNSGLWGAARYGLELLRSEAPA